MRGDIPKRRRSRRGKNTVRTDIEPPFVKVKSGLVRSLMQRPL